MAPREGCRQCVTCLCRCRPGAAACSCGLFVDGRHVSRLVFPRIRVACAELPAPSTTPIRYVKCFRELEESLPTPCGLLRVHRKLVTRREFFGARLPRLVVDGLGTTGLTPEERTIEFVGFVDELTVMSVVANLLSCAG